MAGFPRNQGRFGVPKPPAPAAATLTADDIDDDALHPAPAVCDRAVEVSTDDDEARVLTRPIAAPDRPVPTYISDPAPTPSRKYSHPPVPAVDDATAYRQVRKRLAGDRAIAAALGIPVNPFSRSAAEQELIAAKRAEAAPAYKAPVEADPISAAEPPANAPRRVGFGGMRRNSPETTTVDANAGPPDIPVPLGGWPKPARPENVRKKTLTADDIPW
jgi:hypothetical protein